MRELVGWGGSSSFFSAGELLLAESSGVRPLGQVVGLSAGQIWSGYLPPAAGGPIPTSEPSEAASPGRWREHPRIAEGWATLRRRALMRLTEQADILAAHAIVGIRATRRSESSGGESVEAVVEFSGTAVRVDAWGKRRGTAVLTLVSTRELALLLQAGVEPVGIAGGFARLEVLPSDETITLSRMRGSLAPNRELEDLTRSMYEARRLALRRLAADGGRLKATGLIGIDLEVERAGDSRHRLPGVVFTVHMLASAIRRPASRRLAVQPVVGVSGPAGG